MKTVDMDVFHFQLWKKLRKLYVQCPYFSSCNSQNFTSKLIWSFLILQIASMNGKDILRYPIQVTLEEEDGGKRASSQVPYIHITYQFL